MLVDLKRTVAYICPMCSNISSKRVSVFDFSGKDKLRLICPTHGCHEECAVLTAKGEKYNISIECPLCGEKHSYTSSQGNFWHKSLLSYKCPAAGMDIFFAGGSREVQKAIEDSSETYSDTVSDSISGIFNDIDNWEFSDDYSILFEIIDRLNILNNNHRLSCCCGSDSIETIADGNSVILRCKECKRMKVIDSGSETLARLLNTTQIIIED